MKKSSIILILIVVVFFVSAIVETRIPRLFYESYFVSGLVVAFLTFWWVREHASESNVVAPSWLKLLAALLAPIGVPLYFFRGFGAKLGFIKTLKAVGVFVVVMIIYEIPYMVA